MIERDSAIVELEWNDSGDVITSGMLGDAVAQLLEYFEGRRQTFDLPLQPRGSDFQQKFYAALCAIPFGETRTYGDLAADLGVSAQAIGQACGANPIAILIPCHRVLGATGLGGFSGAGGVEAKVELLKLEGAASLLI
ncbi:MAG: methylated-DNA--[protein]-cysteine S-methyltransferase [Litoreibacter sp.]|uniref:methylated-DNA--[protein]-cysteine S-methyltransferase n=1 Tax=Litoreibacter sp. TaxID=1969459 RepID=UPI003297A5F0